ncbi:MAG: hypothetical protein BWY37_01874 [Firmicutes bacterium ADurb.Bin262]|nr:MAG: hypothetical protein BWY37_01874 [Firmicutes bacterium ADurb.Bin262]
MSSVIKNSGIWSPKKPAKTLEMVISRVRSMGSGVMVASMPVCAMPLKVPAVSRPMARAKYIRNFEKSIADLLGNSSGIIQYRQVPMVPGMAKAIR